MGLWDRNNEGGSRSPVGARECTGALQRHPTARKGHPMPRCVPCAPWRPPEGVVGVLVRGRWRLDIARHATSASAPIHCHTRRLQGLFRGRNVSERVKWLVVQQLYQLRKVCLLHGSMTPPGSGLIYQPKSDSWSDVWSNFFLVSGSSKPFWLELLDLDPSSPRLQAAERDLNRVKQQLGHALPSAHRKRSAGAGGGRPEERAPQQGPAPVQSSWSARAQCIIPESVCVKALD